MSMDKLALMFSICTAFPGYCVLSIWNQGATESECFSHRQKQLLSSISGTWCPPVFIDSLQRAKWLVTSSKSEWILWGKHFLGVGGHFIPSFAGDTGLWNLCEHLEPRTVRYRVESLSTSPLPFRKLWRSDCQRSPRGYSQQCYGHWHFLFSGHTSTFKYWGWRLIYIVV